MSDKPVCPVCGAAIRREVFHEDGARVDQWHCLTCGYKEYADDEAVRLLQEEWHEWGARLEKEKQERDRLAIWYDAFNDDEPQNQD